MVVYYDGWCPLCIKTRDKIELFDWFHLIELRDIRIKQNGLNIPFSRMEKEMHCYYIKSGVVKTGIDAVAAIIARLPLLCLLWIPIKISISLGLGQKLYSYVAENRKIVPVNQCIGSSCDLNQTWK